MQIGNITEALKPDIIKKIDKKGEKSHNSRIEDTFSVSKEGKGLNQSQNTAFNSHISLLPDVRQDRIDQVKLRIKEGFYNSPQFAEQLAEKLISEI
ncbi:MAG: flagellar biosynthesis anti-sigma factor FlgM [bacterium]